MQPPCGFGYEAARNERRIQLVTLGSPSVLLEAVALQAEPFSPTSRMGRGSEHSGRTEEAVNTYEGLFLLNSVEAKRARR